MNGSKAKIVFLCFTIVLSFFLRADRLMAVTPENPRKFLALGGKVVSVGKDFVLIKCLRSRYDINPVTVKVLVDENIKVRCFYSQDNCPSGLNEIQTGASVSVAPDRDPSDKTEIKTNEIIIFPDFRKISSGKTKPAADVGTKSEIAAIQARLSALEEKVKKLEEK